MGYTVTWLHPIDVGNRLHPESMEGEHHSAPVQKQRHTPQTAILQTHWPRDDNIQTMDQNDHMGPC